MNLQDYPGISWISPLNLHGQGICASDPVGESETTVEVKKKAYLF